jgi:hypothetical protein
MVRNKLTIARVKKLNRAVAAPVSVGTGRAITVADHGKILLVTAAITLTIPQDALPAGFQCWIVPPTGVNLSVDPLGTVSLNAAGTTLTRDRATAGNKQPLSLYVMAANTALLEGA